MNASGSWCGNACAWSRPQRSQFRKHYLLTQTNPPVLLSATLELTFSKRCEASDTQLGDPLRCPTSLLRIPKPKLKSQGSLGLAKHFPTKLWSKAIYTLSNLWCGRPFEAPDNPASFSVADARLAGLRFCSSASRALALLYPGSAKAQEMKRHPWRLQNQSRHLKPMRAMGKYRVLTLLVAP